MTVGGSKSSNNLAVDNSNKEQAFGLGHVFESSVYWFLLEKSDKISGFEAGGADSQWKFGGYVITGLTKAQSIWVYIAPLTITLDNGSAPYCSIKQASKVSDSMASRTVNVYVNGTYVGKQSGTHYFPVRGDIKSSDLSVSPVSGYILDPAKGSGTGITVSGTTYNVYLVQQYQVAGSIDHGTKTNSPQTVNHGSSSAAMVFTPAANYVISGVTVNGVAVSGWTANSYTYPAQTITEDKTVVVSTLNKYTVSYNGNGSTSGSMADQSFVYGTAQNLRVNGFTRTLTVSFDGQGGTPASSSLSSTSEHIGWATSSTGAVVYQPVQSVNNLTTTPGATVTLYAKWTDKAVTLPSATKEHYKLDGWYTSASGGTRVGGAGDSYVPTSASVTLYARWSLADANVVITRSGLAEGESAIYTVTGGGRTYTVILTGPDASVTLEKLPIDTYTVTESGWSWNSLIPAPQSADITGGHTFSFTAAKKTDQPLNSESSRKNW